MVGALVGVTSYSLNDQSGYCGLNPGVYTRVAPFVPWIMNETAARGLPLPLTNPPQPLFKLSAAPPPPPPGPPPPPTRPAVPLMFSAVSVSTDGSTHVAVTNADCSTAHSLEGAELLVLGPGIEALATFPLRPSSPAALAAGDAIVLCDARAPRLLYAAQPCDAVMFSGRSWAEQDIVLGLSVNGTVIDTLAPFAVASSLEPGATFTAERAPCGSQAACLALRNPSACLALACGGSAPPPAAGWSVLGPLASDLRCRTRTLGCGAVLPACSGS